MGAASAVMAASEAGFELICAGIGGASMGCTILSEGSGALALDEGEPAVCIGTASFVPGVAVSAGLGGSAICPVSPGCGVSAELGIAPCGSPAAAMGVAAFDDAGAGSAAKNWAVIVEAISGRGRTVVSGCRP